MPIRILVLEQKWFDTLCCLLPTFSFVNILSRVLKNCPMSSISQRAHALGFAAKIRCQWFVAWKERATRFEILTVS
jgi:hypothetical protein